MNPPEALSTVRAGLRLPAGSFACVAPAAESARYSSPDLLSHRSETGPDLPAAIAIALACATFPVSGMMTDRFGRKPVLLFGYVAFIVIALPAFMILGATGSIVVVGLVYFVYMTLNGVVQVPAFPLFTELFPRATRYTGVSLGFNIGTIAAGGTAPYVAAQLVESTGSSMSPAYWVVGVCLIGAITLLSIRETSRDALPA